MNFVSNKDACDASLAINTTRTINAILNAVFFAYKSLFTYAHKTIIKWNLRVTSFNPRFISAIVFTKLKYHTKYATALRNMTGKASQMVR